MNSSNDIVARIRDKFLEAVEQDSERSHLAAGLRQKLGEDKPPKAAELFGIYEQAVVSKLDEDAQNRELSK